MQPKVLPIILPPTLYRQLELDGRAQERDAVQQARWILKQALTNDRPTISREPEAAAR